MKRTLNVLPLLFALLLGACGQALPDRSADSPVRLFENTKSSLYSPCDSGEYQGMQYEEVQDLFSSAGFKNINLVSMDDIDSKSETADGSVETVTVNGSEDYTAQTEFDEDAGIIISYHRIPRVAIPLTPEEASSMYYMDAGKQFFDTGFLNVETDEVYDLEADADWNTVITANGQPIDGLTELPFDTEISVIGHYPSPEYPLNINIDFKSNWIFDKYDVKAVLGGVELGTMDHGEGTSYNVELPAGSYKLEFISTKDSDVTGSAVINVNSKTSISYKISCEGKQVNVNETGFEQELKNGQIMVPFSSDHCLRKNYEDIENEFKALGFKNVKIEAVTDHYWHPEALDHTVKIDINGKTEFSHDAIFSSTDTVTVYYHVADFAFDETSVSVTEKERFDLDYTLNSDDPLESILFEISDEKVLRRNDDGTFTALIPGTAVVSAYCGGKNYSKCEIDVAEIIVPIEKLEFPSEEINVSVGSTFKPEYKIIPENANYTDMTGEISNNFIEENEDGTFYSNEAGDSEISFYQDDQLLGSCTVHAEMIDIEDLAIKDPAEEIVMGEKTDLIFELSPENATNKGITVTSSNDHIAEVEFDERGESVVHVTGKEAGDATITIRIPDGRTYTHTLTVSEIKPDEIIVRNNTADERIEVGTPIELEVEWNPKDTSVKEVTWTSSNNYVVRRNDEGGFEAVGIGEAVITATHRSGLSGTITITVLPTQVERVSIEMDKDSSKPFYVGNSFTITANAFPENATDKTLTFTSSDESVVKVNQWGVVTGVGAGKATVSVTSKDGPSRTISVTVTTPPTPEPTTVTRQNTDLGYSGNSGTSNFQTYDNPYSGPAPYIGNASSGVFHHSWCGSVAKMADHNKVALYSRDDAVNSGYRPCQRCNP